jgi:hypothetical protein
MSRLVEGRVLEVVNEALHAGLRCRYEVHPSESGKRFAPLCHHFHHCNGQVVSQG